MSAAAAGDMPRMQDAGIAASGVAGGRVQAMSCAVAAAAAAGLNQSALIGRVQPQGNELVSILTR